MNATYNKSSKHKYRQRSFHLLIEELAYLKREALDRQIEISDQFFLLLMSLIICMW